MNARVLCLEKTEKKNYNSGQESARSQSDILQSEGKGIIGKCGLSTEGIRGYENSNRRTETRKDGI